MGIFKKALARMRGNAANRREKRKHRKNAGDRHHSRKNARIERRRLKRERKHEMKKEKLLLKQQGRGSTWQTIMDKVGPVANKFIGMQREDSDVVDYAFENGDGTVEMENGQTITPRAGQRILLGAGGVEEMAEAGALDETFEHDGNFVDADGDGYDDNTGLDKSGKTKFENNKNTNSKNARMGINFNVSGGAGAPTTQTSSYAWGKQEGEGFGSYVKRLYTDKPLVMWTSTICVVGLVAWGAVAAVKAWKNKAKTGWKK